MLVIGLLGLSTVAMMLAQVLQPALIALGRHRVTTRAWLAGTAVFFAVIFAPVQPLAAAVTAQVAAPALVVAWMAAALHAEPPRQQR